MGTLTTIQDRVADMLADAGLATYSSGNLQESLQRALDEYSQYNPLSAETVITLPGDGWEVALNGIEGLLRVTAVHWPYDTTLSEAEQYTNKISHWFLWWDDAQPVITLVTTDGDEPKMADELRLWYEKTHTIEGLGSGTLTTLPTLHESILVVGAAGFAAMTQAEALMIATDSDMYATTLLATWGRTKEREFRLLLANLANQINRSGPVNAGWTLDKWDRKY
jgi:hypothetical protein